MSALLATMRPGSWADAPNTTLLGHCYADVKTAPDYNAQIATNNAGDFGCSAVLQVYTGGAHDTISGRSIHTGGGHLAYNGNELYAFNFGSLTWERLDTPDDYGQFPLKAANGDPISPINWANGDPYASTHNYGTTVFVPTRGPKGSVMFCNLAMANGNFDACYSKAGDVRPPLYCTGVYFYDLSASKTLPTKLGIPGSGWSAVDLGNGNVWANNGSIAGFDPVRNRVIRVTNTANPASYWFEVATSAVTPTHGGGNNSGMLPNYLMSGKVRGKKQELWCFGGKGATRNPSDTGIVRVDLRTGNVDCVSLKRNGPVSSGFEYVSYPAVEYHAPTDRFIVWIGDVAWTQATGWNTCARKADPNTVIVIDPVAMTATDHPAHNGGITMDCTAFADVTDSQIGINGKFYFDAPHNCFVMPVIAAQNVQIYKPDF